MLWYDDRYHLLRNISVILIMNRICILSSKKETAPEAVSLNLQIFPEAPLFHAPETFFRSSGFRCGFRSRAFRSIILFHAVLPASLHTA